MKVRSVQGLSKYFSFTVYKFKYLREKFYFKVPCTISYFLFCSMSEKTWLSSFEFKVKNLRPTARCDNDVEVINE